MNPIKPVLQIEPTDFCNLACAMCSPQKSGKPHGNVKPGFMAFDLYKKIIHGIAKRGPDLDHMILQWLGEPTLHPQWLDMLETAIREAGHRFGYFRVDTNAVLLDHDASIRLCRIARDNPGRPIVLIFSLDAATRDTYIKLKGKDRFEQVVSNIEDFLRLRKEKVNPAESPLNVQFQLVLQQGNAHEVRAFIDKWDGFLFDLGSSDTYDTIMIKRLAVGTGGQGQRQADLLYEKTISRLGLRPGKLGACRLELWLDRPWEEE
ncbi:MAG: radical SAM protein [Deltaproteobacteria bacterium]|nr:radical SAM protein [Deltaproteobacteria bacterium]